MREYKIHEGSVHQQFLASRARIQIFGGGFGNGKTTAACVKAIELAKDYPGSNGLIARSTFPKLNDTIRKVFKEWCPPKLIKSFPESKNSDNTAKFHNGSMVNFRYIAQQGKSAEQSTSNLLSATYDWVIVDQMEDPEISEKDFYDLQGRLRGNTVYRGSDPTMPKVGPQFIILTVNPTGNWFYRRIIRPLKLYQETGKITDDLLCYRHPDSSPMYDEQGNLMMMVELFEGPTNINSHNLTKEFIMGLESTYRGQMRERFLEGKWATFEGLIYPDYAAAIHSVTNQEIENALFTIRNRGQRIRWIEGYDFGIQSPSCYLLGAVLPSGQVIIVDGFYKPEFPIDLQAKAIKSIRAKWGVNSDRLIFADPSIFRRTSLTAGTVGESTIDLFNKEGDLYFRRGNNDIENGIVKVSSYLTVQDFVRNPFTGEPGSPLLFVSDDLQWWHDEISGYMWKKRTDGSETDTPVDKNDHAMDATKYMFSELPSPLTLKEQTQQVPAWMQWQEREVSENSLGHRYG